MLSFSLSGIRKVLFPVVLLAGNSVQASQSGPAVDARSFGVTVSPSRVIYPAEGRGAELTVENPQDYPILVRTTFVAEDKKSAVPFIATPPLFRLNGKQQSKIRLVRTGGDYPSDKESMVWACVQGIPPESAGQALKDVSPRETSVSIQLSISTCMKVFIRPSSLTQEPQDVGNEVIWRNKNGKLAGNNPTPYYLSFNDISVNGKKVRDPGYIAPGATHEYDLPVRAGNNVTWKVITDYGGYSREFSAVIK